MNDMNDAKAETSAPHMDVMSDADVPSTLRELLDSAVPAVAASFSDQSTGESIALAWAEGLDVFELRIDRNSLLDPTSVVADVQRFDGLPTIATIRTQADGGEWSGSDAERLELFSEVLEHVDGIDIELTSEALHPMVIDEAKAAGAVVIVSHHDFAATPPAGTLADIAHRAKDLGADFVKISVMANSVADLATMAAFTLDYSDLGVITISMGAEGTASRVLFPLLGSRLTYASTTQWHVSGQLSYGDTIAELRRFSPQFAQRLDA